MRTPKSLAAGIGAGTSIVAAGTLALASVSAIVVFEKWPIPEVPVPRAVALTAKAGADAAQRAAAGGPLMLAEVDAARFPRERELGRSSSEGRTRPGGARRADDGSVAGASSGASTARRPIGGRTGTVPGAGAPLRDAGSDGSGGARSTGDTAAETTRTAGEAVKQVGTTVDRDASLAPSVGAVVQDTTTKLGDAVTQVGDAAGSAIDTTTGAVQDTTQTVTGVVGHAVDTTTQTVDPGAVGQATKTAGSLLDPRR